MRWEYTSCDWRELRALGEQGWEAYSATYDGERGETNFHLKRPIKEEESDAGK